MRTFDYSGYETRNWDTETVNYLTQIHEARGRQTYAEKKDDALARLVEIAKIQSTESSNEIEGIRTTETRLKQLMGEKTTPRNRDEREILGYRDALNVVHVTVNEKGEILRYDMQNIKGSKKADYILYINANNPIAIVEAKDNKQQVFFVSDKTERREV